MNGHILQGLMFHEPRLLHTYKEFPNCKLVRTIMRVHVLVYILVVYLLNQYNLPYYD